MKKKKRMLQILFLTLIIFFSILVTKVNSKLDFDKVEKVSAVGEKLVENRKEVSIIAVGDVLVHDEQIKSAYSKVNNSYEFDNNFKYIKNYISEADIAYVTAEGNFAGKENGYSGYPMFNTPESMLDSLKNTGFDIINGATNHMLDKGVNGYFKTLDNFQQSGMEYVGVRRKHEDKKYVIKDINDIKVGFTSYTYETPRQKGKRAINAITIPSNIDGLLNTFGYEELNKDLLKIKANIDEMKEEGVDIVIVGMHWGTEYSTSPDKYQKQIANKLNEYGVDIILGSHPHVVQPIDTIVNKETGKKTLVAYSMGNFISNQRKETMGNSLSADGVMIRINIEKRSNNEVVIKDYEYIPTWVYKFKDDNNKTQYAILPTEDILKSDNINDLPKEVLEAIETSFKSTTNIIEN